MCKMNLLNSPILKLILHLSDFNVDSSDSPGPGKDVSILPVTNDTHIIVTIKALFLPVLQHL